MDNYNNYSSDDDIDDIKEENKLEYSIKTSLPEEVISLFKTISISIINTAYIYNSMANPFMPEFIKDVMTPFVNKGYGDSVICNFLDGWSDFNWDDKLLVTEKEDFKKMLISFLRTDKIKLDEAYIPIIYNIFNISYYAETMMG